MVAEAFPSGPSNLHTPQVISHDSANSASSNDKKLCETLGKALVSYDIELPFLSTIQRTHSFKEHLSHRGTRWKIYSRG